ncbi:LacI family DNA-binding transcriptional regulator [Nakamurella lactea]|uniref:LacI family DNA-binding transcriptional regulator n=1 Tax=Nakamurella lactea TaxID=459515 RepID=UPI0004284259|nr:LacI family DNA-binding transcriptional regulator [Nakamurella lactea]
MVKRPAGPSAGLKDVAALAGVSASTVSNYLNRPEVVNEHTRSKIDRAVQQLGFVRNESARQLRAGSSRTFAVVLLDAWIPFYGELARGVEDIGSAGGWTVLFSNSARDPERELRNLDTFAAQRVGGILVVPAQDLRDRLRNLQRQGISCVTVEQPANADDISSVEIDDLAGGRAAAEHLLGCRRRDVVLVGNPERVSHVKDRFDGFSRTADAAGARRRLLETWGLTMRDGADAARSIIEMTAADRPDAVFAANDLIAVGLLHELRAAGIDVPGDIAVIGYDGSEFAANATVPLSTVAQPAYEMGVAAAEILLACMAGREEPGQSHRSFRPVVTARESTLGRQAGGTP